MQSKSFFALFRYLFLILSFTNNYLSVCGYIPGFATSYTIFPSTSFLNFSIGKHKFGNRISKPLRKVNIVATRIGSNFRDMENYVILI